MNPTTLADVDTVIINANILTLDRDCPHAQAIAFAAGRILALGTTQELSPLAGRAATVVDARGSTLLPGFIDSHSHLMFGGVVAQALDLTEAACLSDLLDMVRSRAQSTPEGEWIRGYGVAAGRLKE